MLRKEFDELWDNMVNNPDKLADFSSRIALAYLICHPNISIENLKTEETKEDIGAFLGKYLFARSIPYDFANQTVQELNLRTGLVKETRGYVVGGK